MSIKSNSEPRKANKNWFHVALHPQAEYHDEGTILGTVEGLLALRGMIDTCLSSGQNVTGAIFDPGDGEGYFLNVGLVSETEMSECAGANYKSVTDVPSKVFDAFLHILAKKSKSLYDVDSIDGAQEAVVVSGTSNKPVASTIKKKARRRRSRKKQTTVS